MDEKIKKIREVQATIREILLNDWDPIGVADIAEAQDEYDSYVGPVFRIVASRSGSFPIAQYLRRIATDRMGLSGSKTEIELEPLGQKLTALAHEL